MSYFNEEQQGHMAALAQAKPEDKCGCGWYWVDECRTHCGHGGRQRPEDALAQQYYQKGKEVSQSRAEGIVRHFLDNYCKPSDHDDTRERKATRDGMRLAAHAILREMKDKNRVG